MDLYERQELQEFLVSLFGKQAKSWPMSEGIFNLTYELVEESSSCSSAMDYVPRPVPYGSNPFKWLTKQTREMFVRALKDNKEQYVVCLRAAAVRMVRQFQMAAMGI